MKTRRTMGYNEVKEILKANPNVRIVYRREWNTATRKAKNLGGSSIYCLSNTLEMVHGTTFNALYRDIELDPEFAAAANVQSAWRLK